MAPWRHGRLPPEDALAVIVGRIQHGPIHLFQELALACGTFRIGGWMLLVLGRPPVVGDFDHDDVLVVLLGGGVQVIAQIEQAAVPPGIIRLADDVELDASLVAVVEEIFRAFPVTAAIDVDHDQRARRIAGAGFDAANAGLE